MEYPSFGRPQRPKGSAYIKQALKVILVFAVCAWLVYQMKHTNNQTENHGGRIELVVGYGALSLGRKGTLSMLDGSALRDLNIVSAAEATDSSSGRDNVFHGAREDKAEEEFGHVNEKLQENQGKEMEHDPESQSAKRPMVNDSQSNDKELEIHLRELPNSELISKNDKFDFSGKEDDEQKAMLRRESVTGSATNAGMTDGMDNQVLSFHDENGVPPDGDEIKIILSLHEEIISNFSKGIRLGKSIIDEVTPGGDNDVEMNLEGYKNDDTADGEFNYSNVTHVNISGINSDSEISGDSQVL